MTADLGIDVVATTTDGTTVQLYSVDSSEYMGADFQPFVIAVTTTMDFVRISADEARRVRSAGNKRGPE